MRHIPVAATGCGGQKTHGPVAGRRNRRVPAGGQTLVLADSSRTQTHRIRDRAVGSASPQVGWLAPAQPLTARWRTSSGDFTSCTIPTSRGRCRWRPSTVSINVGRTGQRQLGERCAALVRRELLGPGRGRALCRTR
jgi:hypothetical protein